MDGRVGGESENYNGGGGDFNARTGKEGSRLNTDVEKERERVRRKSQEKGERTAK